jgi:GNAT superfamily N-acetyltransferase
VDVKGSGQLEVDVTAVPATPERWEDLVGLFAPNRVCAGCWCMFWRVTSSEFQRLARGGAREALRELVEAGPPPGLLAYAGEEAVGWSAVGPRSGFSHIQRSPRFPSADPDTTWAVPCFFIDRRWRGRGVARALLDAAVEHARAAGAASLEGYPAEPPASPADAYTGVPVMFEQAGFTRVGAAGSRRSAWRLGFR